MSKKMDEYIKQVRHTIWIATAVICLVIGVGFAHVCAWWHLYLYGYR